MRREPRWIVTRLPRLWGKVATTVPPLGVLIVAKYQHHAGLRAHEVIHWAQALRYGVLGFYVRYVWLTLRELVGGPRNAMEVEAGEIDWDAEA